MAKINSRGSKISTTLRGPLAHQDDDSFESFSFQLPSGLLQDQPTKQKFSSNDQSSWNYNCPADTLFSNGKILPHAYPFPTLISNNNPGTDQVSTSRTRSNSSSSKDSFVSCRSSSTGSSSSSSSSNSNSNSRSSSCNNSTRRFSTIESNTAAAATRKKLCSLNDLLAKTSEEKEIYGYNSPRRSRAPVHRKELKLKEAKVVESSSASSSVFKSFGSACRGCRVVEPSVKRGAVIYSRK